MASDALLGRDEKTLRKMEMSDTIPRFSRFVREPVAVLGVPV
jgi:hypothetical protein